MAHASNKTHVSPKTSTWTKTHKGGGLRLTMPSHIIGCVSWVNIYKWQINKEGSKSLLTCNIVNILLSNMRGERCC